MNRVMYKVKCIEKFEDMYVVEGDEIQYESIQSACIGFENVARALLNNSNAIEGLRLYIEDYHSDDDDIDSYSIGIIIELTRENEQIASLDLMFDPRSNTLKYENLLTIEYQYLSAFEEDQLENLSSRF